MACEICKKPYIPDDNLNTDDKPHVCNVCGKGFSLKIQLKRHILSHEGDVPYICITCENHLEPTSYNLRQSQKGNFACETCEKSFPSKRLLLRHASEHTSENAVECDQCSESFKNLTALKKHAAVHKSKRAPRKEKAVSYICMDCGKKFYRLKAFEKHQLTHKYVCDHCEACFVSNKLLEEHRASDSCKSKILNSSSLDSNTNNNSFESEERKHSCTVCNKSFSRKSALEGHMASHFSDGHDSPVLDDSDVDADFQCSYKDDKVSADKIKRQCLPKLKIRRSYPCDKCDVVCASKKSYDKHVEAHQKVPEPPTTKEDIKIYTCRICNETFNTKENYKKHKKLHDSKDKEAEQSGTKRTYTCQICKNVFCKKRHLRRHLKSHFSVNDPNDTSSLSSEDILLGKRPKRTKSFACNFCGKLFAGQTCWKKHEAKHLEEEEGGAEAEGGGSSPREKKMPKKPPKNFVCDFCQEDFSGRKQNFIRHKQSHTPEVCGICDARFVDRASLREHCRIHIGTEEGQRFLECSQKALNAKNGVVAPEPKVEYIYLVLR